MNKTCGTCSGPIHWVPDENCFYHDSITDTLRCPAIDIEPATVTA